MEKRKLHLLILEDNPDDAELAVKELEREGFVVEWTMIDTEEGFRKAFEKNPDLILVDYSVPSFDGMAALQMRQQLAPEIPLIIVSGTIGEEVAVECIKSGATDYVLKDRVSRLGPVVKRALEEAEAYRERELAEEALQESETRFRELVDLLPQIIFEMDERGNLTFVNSNAFDIFGFTQDDFDKGLAALQMLRPEDRNRGRDNIGRVIKGGKPDSAEYMAQRKDGSTFPVIIYSSPIIRENKPVGLRGIIVDITEQKQAEEEKKKLEAQLQQAQKMEAVGTLAGGIAHDFNNILAAIIGYTELAMIDFPEGSHSKQNLKEVLKASYRARDLVKQILTFSRQTKQELRPVQISPIVKEALKLLRSSLPTTIEIRQNIETPPGSDTVEADPTQIHQVLMNLCTNAAHAMQENGGVLEVNLRNVSIGDWGLGISEFEDKEKQSAIRSPQSEIDLGPGQYLKLTVRDTGHGMPPELLRRIFDPYFTTKEKDKGTGLGLAVVHGIVKGYGGTITVDSEPGRGTTFNVYLPRIEREVTAEPEPGPGGIPTGHERILFVDDEKALVEIGRQMLEHLGYEVMTRTSSIEALELFRTKADQFDLVITDMTMPNMTGDKLAIEIMKIRPDMPIILCTGFSERITPEKAKNMGIKAFAMKPLVMRDLADTVRKVLDT